MVMLPSWDSRRERRKKDEERRMKNEEKKTVPDTAPRCKWLTDPEAVAVEVTMEGKYRVPILPRIVLEVKTRCTDRAYRQCTYRVPTAYLPRTYLVQIL